jgi:hypothetical protein
MMCVKPFDIVATRPQTGLRSNSPASVLSLCEPFWSCLVPIAREAGLATIADGTLLARHVRAARRVDTLMLGCLRRFGCLLVLVCFAGGLYLTRHRWLPFVTPAGRDAIAELPWAPLSEAGAERVRGAMARLARYDGPVFSNVAAADLASFLLDSVVTGATSGARSAEAAIRRDEILLRTKLRVGDLGADAVPLLGGVAGRTATVIVGGTLAVERPGLGAWRIQRIDVDAISIPGWAVPRVTRELARRLRRAGTTDGAFGFALPPQVADVRIGHGIVTLYKVVP